MQFSLVNVADRLLRRSRSWCMSPLFKVPVCPLSGPVFLRDEGYPPLSPSPVLFLQKRFLKPSSRKRGFGQFPTFCSYSPISELFSLPGPAPTPSCSYFTGFSPSYNLSQGASSTWITPVCKSIHATPLCCVTFPLGIIYPRLQLSNSRPTKGPILARRLPPSASLDSVFFLFGNTRTFPERVRESSFGNRSPCNDYLAPQGSSTKLDQLLRRVSSRAPGFPETPIPCPLYGSAICFPFKRILTLEPFSYIIFPSPCVGHVVPPPPPLSFFYDALKPFPPLSLTFLSPLCPISYPPIPPQGFFVGNLSSGYPSHFCQASAYEVVSDPTLLVSRSVPNFTTGTPLKLPPRLT